MFIMDCVILIGTVFGIVWAVATRLAEKKEETKKKSEYEKY